MGRTIRAHMTTRKKTIENPSQSGTASVDKVFVCILAFLFVFIFVNCDIKNIDPKTKMLVRNSRPAKTKMAVLDSPSVHDTMQYPAANDKIQYFYSNELCVKRNGKCVLWYDNAHKKVDCTYRNGKLDGRFISWYQNGNIRQEATYKDGLLNGKYIWWYDDGHECRETIFQNGKPAGDYIEWYPNGQKSFHFTYGNGVKNGCLAIWYWNGQKREEINYLNTGTELIANGRRTWWYENGSKAAEVNYAKGYPAEKCLAWHLNGQQAPEVIFKKGYIEISMDFSRRKGGIPYQVGYWHAPYPVGPQLPDEKPSKD
jgi:antitoxin component YwqK of YwqJK toxin-antitoxin module